MRKIEAMNKVISMLICLCMILQFVPAAVFATETDNLCEHHAMHTEACGYVEGEMECTYHCDECLGVDQDEEEIPEESPAMAEETHTVEIERVVPDVNLPDNDELFAMYVEQELYGYETATYGTRARERLNKGEKAIYDVLKAKIESVASNGGATEFVLTEVPGLTTSWTREELGVESITGEDIANALFAQFALENVVTALLDDCPFDLYWFDKSNTGGYGMYYSYGYAVSGNGVVTSATVTNMQFNFYVSADYRGGSNTLVTTNVSKIAGVKTAAQAVVTANASKSDYEKLVGYKNYICNAVSYNFDAIAADYARGYGDPWQLIYVFDGDSSTNVVCEGYSKAFQYLCDLGGLDCISVSGLMDGGGHMWNVVTLEGKNYLVDVTNVDDGMIGSDGSLFMAGTTYGGGQYVFTCYGTPVTFTSENLNLATENYTPGQGSTEHVHSYTASNPTCSCGMAGYCGGEGNGTNLTWVLEDDTLTISGTGTMDDYASSDSPWNSYWDSIVSVVIEDGVTSIGNDAFWWCSSLTEISIPESVTSIGAYAFYGCSSLTEITIPDSVTNIYKATFYNCSSLTEVNIPDSVTNIGYSAFYNCSSLTKITFDGKAPIFQSGPANSSPRTFYNVTATAYYPVYDITWTDDVMQQYDGTITWVPYGMDHVHSFDAENPTCSCGMAGYYGGEGNGTNLTWNLSNSGALTISGTGSMYDSQLVHGYANTPWFDYRNNITSLVVESGVTTIGNYVVYMCTNLTEVIIPNSVTSIGDGVFSYCRSLTAITIPNSVTSMGDEAFFACDVLTEITIPNSVTSIGDDAFSGCDGLTEIIIPNSVTSIGVSPFSDCRNLNGIWVSADNPAYSSDSYGVLFDINKTTLIQVPCTIAGTYHIPDGVTTIGDYAFYNCQNLTKTTLPDSVISLGDWAFDHCQNLAEVTIPEGVISIGYSAFGSCYSLTDIPIPKSVRSIGSGAFNQCITLKEIIIPEGVTSIGDYTFVDCYDLTKVILPDGILSIGDGAFTACRSLTEITIPDSVTSIGNEAFYGCGSLKNINIPEGVTQIEFHTFLSCENLTEITIPKSVTSIGGSAFSGCTSLSEITFCGNAPAFELGLESYAFFYVTATVYYPANDETWTEDVMQDYGGTITWVPYDTDHVHSYDIENPVCSCGAAGYCGGEDDGTNLTWNYDNGTLTIIGTGAMADYASPESSPWYIYRDSIVSVIIEPGVTSVGKFALRDCTTLTNVSLPEGFLSIGTAAFLGCYSLQVIDLPSTLTTLGNSAFSQCFGLERMYIPSSVTFLGDAPFSLCCSLTEIVVDSMNPSYCSENNQVLFNKDKTVLHQILPNASGSYTVPESVTRINRLAFYGCMLSEIIISDSVTEIGDCAFSLCLLLTSIELPDQLTVLENAVLSDCRSLQRVTIPKSVKYVDNSVFTGNELLMEEIIFEGSAPEFANNAFEDVTSKVYYPANDPTWTKDVMQQYGGTITWVPYGTGNAISGTVTSYGEEVDVVTISLIDSNGVTTASTTVTGNSASYSFDAIAAGTYILQVSKVNHVTRSYTVMVEDGDVTQDAEIYLIGDVTNDGKVTATDYSRLLAHVKKISIITDDYILLCADVTSDGKITATDYSRLLAHVKKVNLLW